MFGGGYDGRSYEFGLKTQLTGITLDSSGAAGSWFCGFYLSNIYEYTGAINNITVERCFVTGGMIEGSNAHGWMVRNCILVSVQSLFNATIDNNIFLGPGGIYAFNSNVSNNVFYDLIIYYPNNAIRCTNSILNNNIFVFDSTESGFYPGFNCTSSVFNNNITYSGGGVSNILPPTGNTGSGNINNTNPAFVSTRLDVGIDSISVPAIASYNWQLGSSSPGHNAGIDGSDIGIYGGTFPMPDLQGLPPLPQVRRMDILNPQIPVNGTLHVHVIGTATN